MFLLVRWFGCLESHVPEPTQINAGPKHLVKRVSNGLISAFAPGVVAFGLGLIVFSFAQNSLIAVTPVTAISPKAKPTSVPVATSTPQPTDAPLYDRKPAPDERLGTITLPTLDLSWPIFEGTTEKQLVKGVGHYVDSVLPGVSDNSVLSGHRTSVFNRLGELKIGDEIFVQTSAGVFTYRVELTRVVSRSDRSVIVSTPTGILTLTTCWPFNHVGITTRAYIVTATLQ